MHHRQLLEHVPSGGSQRDVLTAKIIRIGNARHESRGLGPVDELDHGVVPQLERFRQIADDGSRASAVPAYGQQELMLRGRDARVTRGLFRESLEHTQRMTKARERLVFTV